MNLVFMNSLERKVDEDRVMTAQVSICEHQGKWHVLWNEPLENGESAQESWFEGQKWDEMLKVFRLQLQEKTKAGYVPILGGVMNELDLPTGKARFTQLLHYYSELHGDEQLYEKLRLWRRERSSKEGKAPFIFASNRVLWMISAFIPRSKNELLQIPGFGENRVNMYAEDIMEMTKSLPRSREFPLDWVTHEVDEGLFAEWIQLQKNLKERTELDKQSNKIRILEAISEKETLSTIQLQVHIPRRELIQWIEQLDHEGYDLDQWIEEELRSISVEERDAAWKAFEQEGDRYLKPIIRKIYGDDKVKEQGLDHTYEWLRLLRLRYRKEKRSGIQAS